MTDIEIVLLEEAWAAVDSRLHALQSRHRTRCDIPFYEISPGAPAANEQLLELSKAWGGYVPPALWHSLSRWNGRWIAHDHMISLMSIEEHLASHVANSWSTPDESLEFEEVVGPINLRMESSKRYCIGGHEASGTFLYLDFEDPPPGGRLGQVIRTGEEPSAEYVAESFVDFLMLVAKAPAYDDDPEFDPLAWPR